MMWLKLQSNPEIHLHSGSTLILFAATQNEEGVIAMICDGTPSDRNHYSVMALTGSNAGVNCLISLPYNVYEDGKLLTGKVYQNWQAWFKMGDPDKVSFACTEYPDGVVTWLHATDIKQKSKGWLRLEQSKTISLARGALVRFPASYPFEEEVVMMVCEAPHTRSNLGLITITGYKAGINCYVAFPDSTRNESSTLSAQWLYDNWQHWVWPEGSPDDVWILPGGLSVDDMK